jgi:HPt (histidine-containing phosphotransfer) domain-containing protein
MGHPADPSPAGTEAVFNPSGLLALLMGDRDRARKILTRFLNDAPRHLRNLKYYLEVEDVHGARLQAHALKGAAAAVSAEALRALGIEARKAAATGELARARPL